MIRHIVCYKLLDNSNENKLEVQKTLLSMRGNVTMLRGMEVGIDFLASERSYDISLITTFDNLEDLADYHADPFHMTVVKEFMKGVVEKSVAVDYHI